jgi:hypothetical protein
MYSVGGSPLSEAEYKEHLAKVLPGEDERSILEPVFKSGNWMSTGAANA